MDAERKYVIANAIHGGALPSEVATNYDEKNVAEAMQRYFDAQDCTCQFDDWNCWYRFTTEQQIERIVASVA